MSESLTITGVVVHVGELEEISNGKYQKRELWIEVPGQYPRTLPIEFFGKNAAKTDGIGAGQTVTASFTLKGNVWTPNDGRKARCFPKLDGWKIDVHAMDAGDGAVTPDPVEGEDDIPF